MKTKIANFKCQDFTCKECPIQKICKSELNQDNTFGEYLNILQNYINQIDLDKEREVKKQPVIDNKFVLRFLTSSKDTDETIREYADLGGAIILRTMNEYLEANNNLQELNEQYKKLTTQLIKYETFFNSQSYDFWVKYLPQSILKNKSEMFKELKKCAVEPFDIYTSSPIGKKMIELFVKSLDEECEYHKYNGKMVKVVIKNDSYHEKIIGYCYTKIIPNRIYITNKKLESNAMVRKIKKSVDFPFKYIASIKEVSKKAKELWLEDDEEMIKEKIENDTRQEN